MIELNTAEIERVSGGDAAATRIGGQNAWGENVPGGLTHYLNAGARATFQQASQLLLQDCLSRNMTPPAWSCITGAITGFGADKLFQTSE